MTFIIGSNKVQTYTKEQLLADPKVHNVDIVADSLYFLKRQKVLTKIGLYIGRFPVLTAKECAFLSLCRTKCDILVIAIESDYAIRLKKEPKLSQTDKERAFGVANLTCVDWVVIFDEEKPDLCVSKLQPDLIFHGLYHGDDKLVTLAGDKLTPIETPWEKTAPPSATGNYKFFDVSKLGIE